MSWKLVRRGCTFYSLVAVIQCGAGLVACRVVLISVIFGRSHGWLRVCRTALVLVALRLSGLRGHRLK